jgi:hypothetical protein
VERILGTCFARRQSSACVQQHLRLLDTIQLWQPPDIFGLSCFEGLDHLDREIVQRNGTAIPTKDSNAYEYATTLVVPRLNLGDLAAPLPPNMIWPRTTTRSATQSTLGKDISPFTQPGPIYLIPSPGRLSLYINDIFRRHILAGQTSLIPKISAHDFRLAPMAEDLDGMKKNPLINFGIDFGVDPMTGKALHTGSLRFAMRYS